MKTINRITIAIAVAMLTPIWVISVATPDDGLIAFGLVGVTHGQSVQLNVSNIQPTPDDSMATSVELMIFDSDGVVLAQSMERIARGRSASLTLNRDLLDRREIRLGLRAVVKLKREKGNPPPDHSIVASFELVDNSSQQTLVVVPPWVLKGFNPQPEPPAPLAR